MAVDDDPPGADPHTELARALGNQANNRRSTTILGHNYVFFPRFTDFRRKMPHEMELKSCAKGLQ